MPRLSCSDVPSSSRDKVPVFAAWYMAGPALLPKRSMAACNFSVSDALLCIVVENSLNTSGRVFPSFAAATTAFLRPVMTWEVSTPDFSRLPRKYAESLALIPISLRDAAFVTMDEVSVSMLIPVACPTAFSVSRSAPASSAFTPKASMTFCVWSIEDDTSVWFSSANLTNFSDRSSSACPVRPNRVFTSPMAAPAVAKSVGIRVAMFSMDFCIWSRALPEAPVFATMVSTPASTSLKAFTEAAPTATIGAVTFLVMLLPTPETLSPTSCSLLPTFPSFSLTDGSASASFVSFACCSSLFRSCSVWMISRWRPSYWLCVISPFARASFASSDAWRRVFSFSCVSLMASARILCFWAISSVFPGSNFSRRLTSRSWP